MNETLEKARQATNAAGMLVGGLPDEHGGPDIGDACMDLASACRYLVDATRLLIEAMQEARQ